VFGGRGVGAKAASVEKTLMAIPPVTCFRCVYQYLIVICALDCGKLIETKTNGWMPDNPLTLILIPKKWEML